jgi:hypothetical protein
MNRFIIRILFVFMIGFGSSLTLVSCKAKAVVVKEDTASNRLNAEGIVKNHYSNKSEFSTLYIKSNVRYSDEKQTQNVTAEIKIKKDEQILISVRFLGITMAKALITPTAVGYYEKINGSYFEGDFSTLSQWLGTDLDYIKIQNMLIGQPLDDLSKGKYKDTLVDQSYRLEDISNNNTKKYFFFDSVKFLLNKQKIIQTIENRTIDVSYSDFTTRNESQFPSNIIINAMQEKGNTEINLNYNAISINEELNFPYSVPNGYKRISIK